MGNQVGIAATLYHQAILLQQRGNVMAAKDLYRQSLSIFTELCNPAGKAAALY
ncbi:MAG: hypothetical protein ACE5I5_11495 [Candidatus Heimdallarchaeota archaeon]